jgi:hypothetical protein
MWDVICIAAAAAFFALAIGYTLACERLGQRKAGGQ